MKTKALIEVLTTHGECTSSGDKIEVPSSSSVAIYANIGSESLVVSSVRSCDILGDIVLVTTAKNESYAILSEDIRAVRMGAAERRAGLRAARA
jgi:hypothetical protein